MNSTDIQIVTSAMLTSNVILASVLGGFFLYKGVRKRCTALIRCAAVMLAFSVVHWLTAKELSDWPVGALLSLGAVWVLKFDSALDIVGDRVDSIIDRINRAELIRAKC